MTDADRYHIPPQQSVNAAYVLDLKPLIAWFRDELSRERTAAADARCEARGHRERVVELEAKLAEATKPRIEFDYKATLDKQRQEWRALSDNYVQQIKNLEKRAQRAEDKLGKANCERDEARDEVNRLTAQLEHARCDAKDAQQMLVDERARLTELSTKLERAHERVAEWTHKATDLAERLDNARDLLQSRTGEYERARDSRNDFLRERDEARAIISHIEQQWCIEGDYAPDSDTDTRHPIERRMASMLAMHMVDVERYRKTLSSLEEKSVKLDECSLERDHYRNGMQQVARILGFERVPIAEVIGEVQLLADSATRQEELVACRAELASVHCTVVKQQEQIEDIKKYTRQQVDALISERDEWKKAAEMACSRKGEPDPRVVGA